MSTALVPIETLGAEIKARVEAGDRALDKAEQHYIAAGIQLAEAKRRLEQTGEMRWSAFLFSHARIKRRRADDLIAIGQGRITLAEHREKNRERVAAHRERKRAGEAALRNAEQEVRTTPADTVPAWRGKGTPFAPVEDSLPDDRCARAWAHSLATMRVESSGHHTYKALCEAFARLMPDLRMQIMVRWFNSMEEADQRDFHDQCPSPVMPEYMGDWLVEALMTSVNYRPSGEVTDEVKREMAFAEMDKAIEVYRSWSPADREKYEARHSGPPDFIPAFLQREAAA